MKNTQPRTLGLLLGTVVALAAAGALGQSAPRLISTSPLIGSTDVDPSLAEITVTFDRDMDGGMSWTGGGPEFPKSPEGARAQWRDKRTCVLPVKLEGAHLYRVGINAPSFKNFRGADGVPAPMTAIYFTTAGASEELKQKVRIPKIVALEPLNGAKDVSPALKELKVTFNVRMSDGFSWAGGGPQYPASPAGSKPYWTNEGKTCVLPVELKPEMTYRLGFNSQSYRGFQSAGGIPLDPVSYTFRTRQ
jgi:RNA polymerase sigma-70 factor (ECF subfamily)